MIYQTLNGRWLINEKGSESYVEGNVPGSVLSALLIQHRMQDPYFGTNEYAAREIFRNDFYFTRRFDVEPELMSQENIYLCCKGIDTLSKIYINDMPIGRTDNMHRTWYFNVRDYLRLQGNTITIEIESPINYIESVTPGFNREIHYTPVGCMKGNQYLRKAHCMFGWDWGAQLPDCGIWRSIDLIGYSLIRLDEVEIIQHHEKKRVVLEINVDAELIRPDTYIIQAELVTPDGVPSAVTSTLEDGHATLEMAVESPRIWWPNGYGDQPLYTITVYALDMNGNQWDSKTYRIGLREITVSREADSYGNEFCFKVNGIKIFAMGANYIPEDTIYSFITREKISYLLRSAKKSNFNTIRVWGGGYYPSDTFYDLCDELGLIVWQDFMFACNVYELTTDFKNSVIGEAIDNVKRLRHHACLGLFCGNNEIESAWDHWVGGKRKTADPPQPSLKGRGASPLRGGLVGSFSTSFIRLTMASLLCCALWLPFRMQALPLLKQSEKTSKQTLGRASKMMPMTPKGTLTRRRCRPLARVRSFVIMPRGEGREATFRMSAAMLRMRSGVRSRRS